MRGPRWNGGVEGRGNVMAWDGRFLLDYKGTYFLEDIREKSWLSIIHTVMPSHLFLAPRKWSDWSVSSSLWSKRYFDDRPDKVRKTRLVKVFPDELYAGARSKFLESSSDRLLLRQSPSKSWRKTFEGEDWLPWVDIGQIGTRRNSLPVPMASPSTN